ncbi:TIGR02281 family clan AA aspartic protease [Novosphingobium sp. Gsoil 351]|uniref:retropepsin-like aspartic protease family protein n=1 Tax=Novosphingobium sp. Gsoil 351 TaxID=2675225 RepID=UPI0012B4AF51|nr:TIGR02281 family clan AA aspartic protease [Novosphingobium sp. Gsoil 351]QGN55392.1 TIGR02281 family clan AA aspartic protease [Novosphingobium sp. Gsoil 351]
MQKLIPLAAFGGFIWIVFSPHEQAPVRPQGPEAVKTMRLGEQPSGSASAASGFDDAMVLQRDGSGQFHVDAQVEGQDTQFLVDTGADIVALTVDEAGRLGHPVDPAEFVPLMQTASGTGNGAIVRLDRLEVAGTEFHDVDAVVLEGLSVNLLGQTVLAKLGQVSLEGDRMTIRR